MTHQSLAQVGVHNCVFLFHLTSLIAMTVQLTESAHLLTSPRKLVYLVDISGTYTSIYADI